MKYHRIERGFIEPKQCHAKTKGTNSKPHEKSNEKYREIDREIGGKNVTEEKKNDCEMWNNECQLSMWTTFKNGSHWKYGIIDQTIWNRITMTFDFFCLLNLKKAAFLLNSDCALVMCGRTFDFYSVDFLLFWNLRALSLYIFDRLLSFSRVLFKNSLVDVYHRFFLSFSSIRDIPNDLAADFSCRWNQRCLHHIMGTAWVFSSP